MHILGVAGTVVMNTLADKLNIYSVYIVPPSDTSTLDMIKLFDINPVLNASCDASIGDCYSVV